MASRNIWATLSLNTNNFSKGVKSATGSLTNISKGTKQATSNLKAMHNTSKNVADGMKSAFKSLAGTVAAAFSVKAVVDFGKACVEAANNQATAEKRLESTMMNVKGTTMEQVKAIKQYSAELQKNSTIGDDATMQGASQLATFGLQSDSIKSLLPQLQNMAVAQYGVSVSGEQMQSVANTIGKAMSGNAKALKKLIPTMTEEQELMISNGTEAQRAATITELLSNKYGKLAQEMANTPEGRIQQLKNAWGDMQEVVGQQLYPVITKVLTYVMDKIPAIQNALTPIVKLIGNTLSSAVEFLTPIFDKIFGAIMNINKASSPLNGSFKAIKGTLGTIWKVVKDLWNTVSSALKDTIKNNKSVKIIIDNVKATISALGKVISAVWNIIKPVIPYVITAITNVIALITSIGRVFATVVSTIVSAIGSVIDFVKRAINSITTFFTNVKNGIVNIFKGLANIIKAPINAVIKIINSALTKMFGGINGVIKKINDAKNKLGALGKALPNIPTITVPQIPLLANGGTITSPGTVMVGERGPELLNLPRGASVTPLSKNTNNNTTINIYAENKSVDEIISELVPKLKLAIATV